MSGSARASSGFVSAWGVHDQCALNVRMHGECVGEWRERECMVSVSRVFVE